MPNYVPPWLSPGSSGLASAFTVELISDPVQGGEETMACIVFPHDQTALAIKMEGDEFPRWLLASDAVEGLYFGDGTYDPYLEGPCLYVSYEGEEQILSIGRTTNGVALVGNVTVPVGDITLLGGGVVLPAPSGGPGYRLIVDENGNLSTELAS